MQTGKFYRHNLIVSEPWKTDVDFPERLVVIKLLQKQNAGHEFSVLLCNDIMFGNSYKINDLLTASEINKNWHEIDPEEVLHLENRYSKIIEKQMKSNLFWDHQQFMNDFKEN